MKVRHPNDKDPYSLLGYSIEHAQGVEGMIRFVTTFVFQDGDPLTMDRLFSIQHAERKHTLGQFFNKLRRLATLNPAFETSLVTYLDMRNALVHDHKRIAGWDFETEQGIAAATQYMWTFLRLGHQLLEIFAAVIEDWSQQIGMQNTDPEFEAYISQVHQKYQPYLYSIFGGDVDQS